MVEVPRETERGTGAVPGNQRYELSAYREAVSEPYGWMLCTDKGGKITAKVNECLTGFVVGAVAVCPCCKERKRTNQKTIEL